MTAHTRTVSLAAGFMPATTARMSTSRFVVIAASLIEAVIVLGFVSSSLGLRIPPDPDHGWASPAPSIVLADPDIEAAPAPSGASVPEPAPAPAP